MKTIVYDPGHGDTRGQQGYDPGVIFGQVHESDVNIEMAQTLKFVCSDNFKVLLTRDGTAGGKPDLEQRVRFARNNNADAFVSLHYNCVNCGDLIYYAPGQASLDLAKLVAAKLGITRVLPSSSSRFNGLYIDSFPDAKPSIMIEFASINKAPAAGRAGRQQRLEYAEAVEQALLTYFDS